MGTRKPTADDLARIHALAKQWGKVIVRHAFGPDGPGLDVDITLMEEVAGAAAAGLAQGALETATGQQAQALPAEHPCPACGRACGHRPQPRPIQGVHGPFEHREPVCYCPTCRRDFFPPAGAAEAGHPRVHPGGSAEDAAGHR